MSEQPPTTEWTPEYIWSQFSSAGILKIKAICDAHKAALAIERENSDECGRILVALRRELLAAQAAIAEHNKKVATFKPPMNPITVDLSALDKHDAELVEALTESAPKMGEDK